MNVKPFVVALIVCGVTTLAARPQGQAFDVLSIKRNVSGAFPVGPEARRGGSFVAINTTLEWLVRYAYDVPEYRLTGGADWVRRDRFDVEARADRDASAEDIQRMVRTLLQNRFQLVTRNERREGTLYTLVLARDDKRVGPNLRPSAAGCAAPGGPEATNEERRTPNGGVSIRRACALITVLVASLANALRAPVDDKTALAGLWDFELSYTGERRRTASAGAVAQDPNDAPALFTALQEQLGLKLEPGRGAIDVLVIESAVQPTEN